MSITELSSYRRRRALLSSAFAFLCLSATVLCLAVMAILLWTIVYRGLPWLTMAFLTIRVEPAVRVTEYSPGDAIREK